MIKKTGWVLFASLSIIIGLYPVIYFIIDRRFGLLGLKPDAIISNAVWNTAFYLHIILGGLALLIGWMQFSAGIRKRYLNLHRKMGKLYVLAVLMSSLAGIYIGFYAAGGWIPASGFICLGVVWFYSTLKAYTSIKNKQVVQHQKMMIYSYAACFAAVTLRIWLPLLQLVFNNFTTSYLIVAWLCWVPNLIVAYFIVKRLTRV